MSLHKEERLKYSKLLWQDFKTKVIEDWETKYEIYGKNISNIQVTTKFSQALSSDIKKHLAKQNSQYKVPHHLTIDKYFKQDGFPDNVQEASLDVFSIYLGYENWYSFTKEREFKRESEIASNEILSSSPGITSKNNKKVQRLSLLVFLVLSFFVFIFKYRINPSPKNYSAIEAVVRKSIAAEIKAYSLLPDTSAALVHIDSFFLKSGSAHIEISNRLSRIKDRGWVLNNENNPSKADLLDIETKSVKGEFAYVKTKEAWLIKWYETAIEGYVYKYRVMNEQDYILQRDSEGVWKVSSNTYKAEVGKELPSNFKRENYDTSISKEGLNKIVKESIREGLLDKALWHASLYISQHRLSGENEIAILQGRYNNLVREWNLENISREKFLKEKEKTALNLLTITKNL